MLTLKEVTQELNLQYEPQDWGIVNAAAGRLNEFLTYYQEKRELDSNANYCLFELLIASFNEALLEGELDEMNKMRILKFISARKGNNLFEPIFSYWRRIGNTNEYPVGLLI